jgi:hypothetical protein
VLSSAPYVFSERDTGNTEKVHCLSILTVGSHLPSGVVLPLLGRSWHRSLLLGIGFSKCLCHDVTKAWCVFGLQMEEWPPIWRVAANILNRQLTRDGPPAWGLGKGLTTPHCENKSLLQNIHRQSLGPGLTLWYDLSIERGT